jgi:recombination protein RecA
MSKIEKMKQKYGKEFGTDKVKIAKEVPPLSFVSTGIPSLDLAIGGGYPRKCITEIFGMNGSGKSVLSYAAIAEAQRRGEIPALVQTEGEFSRKWAEVFGVDMDNLLISYALRAEEMVDQVKAYSADPDIGLLITDSVAGPGKAKGVEEGGSVQAFGKSALITNMMEALVPNTWETDKVVLLINQVRQKANPRNLPLYESPGGEALHHSCTVRIQIKKGETKLGTKNGEKKEIGHKVKATVIKNQAGDPQRVAEWFLYHTEPDEPDAKFPGVGIDILESLVPVAIAAGVVVRNGAIYSVPSLDFTQSGEKGRDNFVDWLREDKTRIEKIREELNATT